MGFCNYKGTGHVIVGVVDGGGVIPGVGRWGFRGDWGSGGWGGGV